ncbi:MAG: methyl-accepting chemotaxis protein, partial [Thiohalomonadales bacterium]
MTLQDSLDIKGKFIVSIVGGLIVLFSIMAVILVGQQQSALEKLLQTAQQVVEKSAAGNSRVTLDNEKLKIKSITNLLTQISAGPVSELEIDALEGYASAILEDANFSYIGFSDAESTLLSAKGDLSSVDPENVITNKLLLEDIELGSLTVGYNFDHANDYADKVAIEQQLNFTKMQQASDNSLTTAKISLAIIMVIMSIAIAFFVSFLFKLIVCDRLSTLEYRIKEIALGDGDLRKRIEVHSTDIIARIGGHLNTLLEKLQNTVKQVVHSSHELTTAAEEMSVVTAQESENIAAQKNQIEQSAAAISEMSSTVQEVARNAVTAADAAKKADDESNVGMSVVRQTVDSINELAQEVEKASDVIQTLEEDSNAIGVILEVIRGIAEQTNLLALNAAIEAARA